MDRDRGGVLAKTLESRAGVGASFARGFSALSDPDNFSPLSADAAFFRELDSLSGFGLEDAFLASLVGVADHMPHDAPSRLILGRSFPDDLVSGAEGGESGTAGGGGGAGGGGLSSMTWGAADARLDFLLDFFGAMSITSIISSSSSSG
jgi:hypothetical protein